MKYDFTSYYDRHGMDSSAVDHDPEGPSRKGIVLKDGITDWIPMEVADMNFATVPTVPEAMIKRAEHPLFGYYRTRPEYFEEIIEWQTRRNDVRGLLIENIGYENSVLGGVATALHMLCSAGEPVLVHSPCYCGFLGVLNNNGYKTIASPLKMDENGIWRMDFADMDKKIKENRIHVAIFCSPHNPSGRVWERWEIEKAMEVYKDNDVTVISDEIWSDLILRGNKHIPTQSVSDYARNNTIAFYSITKTFNLAGLIGAYHIVYNKTLRERMEKEASLGHYNGMNLMSMYALIGAYKPEGYEWLDELREVLSDNSEYSYKYITENFKGVTLAMPQGTYLLYIDCSEWLKAHGMDLDALLKLGFEAGVDWQDGRDFLKPDTIRINTALPTERVKEAMRRLDKYVFNA
ncbi:MAG: aminotransferase class I/II-fold pyridoxal phosphate-dependent enzyme [Lachnospiraceae bacterium]|nr:aminotransferase class I/II-fold pyridoxal phosphate-dependent enzyme [Lachnospiraceae bacterium]